ncbi:DUF4404 family protein [Mariniblastus fucicola]|uniref:DUF4404 domain-containing protein n=1 Tax=Mariniblastus fucicola TaxID=980251 RepID=A0A5B9P617_9BACT|nr:DUF4404 family protein [Mariniblastus fucicola]QEG20432.1 hypothetical protein MFFC18_02800 [Mariniblastus fucicola]
MEKTELLIRLRELHEELSSINLDQKPADEVDEATVDALGQLVTDASELIDRVKITANGDAEDPIDAEHGVLVERIVEFDQNHPRVREFLTQMTDLLAMMGI